MSLGDLLAQNIVGVGQGVITAVLGYVAVRFLRGIRASADRTEEHAKETAQKVSQLDMDKVSLTASNLALEQWQHDMALRIEAAADLTSDGLAWQAKGDRRFAAIEQRIAAVEKFARDLDAYAHGHSDLPAYTAPNRTTELIGANDGE